METKSTAKWSKKLNKNISKFKKSRRSANFRNNSQNSLLSTMPVKRVLVKNKINKIEYKCELNLPTTIKLTRPVYTPANDKQKKLLVQYAGKRIKKELKFKSSRAVAGWILSTRKLIKKNQHFGQFLHRVACFSETYKVPSIFAQKCRTRTLLTSKSDKNCLFQVNASTKKTNKAILQKYYKMRKPSVRWRLVVTQRLKKKNYGRATGDRAYSRQLVSFALRLGQARRKFLVPFTRAVVKSATIKNQQKLSRLEQLGVCLTRWIQKGLIREQNDDIKAISEKVRASIHKEHKFTICLGLAKVRKLRTMGLPRKLKLKTHQQRGLYTFICLLKRISSKKVQRFSSIKLNPPGSNLIITVRQKVFQTFYTAIRRFAHNIRKDSKTSQLFKYTLKYQSKQACTRIKKDLKVQYKPSLAGFANFLRSYITEQGRSKTKFLQEHKFQKLQNWQSAAVLSAKPQVISSGDVAFSINRWVPFQREKLAQLLSWMKKRKIRLPKKYLLIPMAHKLTRWYIYRQICSDLKKRQISLPSVFKIATLGNDFANSSEVASSLLGITDYVNLVFTKKESQWWEKIRKKSYITHLSKLKEIFFRSARRSKATSTQLKQWEQMLGLPWKLLKQSKLPRRFKKRLQREIQKIQRFPLIKAQHWPSALTEKGWGFESLSRLGRGKVRHKIKALKLLWKLRETKYNPVFTMAKSIATQPLFFSLLRSLYPEAVFSEEDAVEDMSFYRKQKKYNYRKIKARKVKNRRHKLQRNDTRQTESVQAKRKRSIFKHFYRIDTPDEKPSVNNITEILFRKGGVKYKKKIRLIQILVTHSSFQRRLRTFKKEDSLFKNKITDTADSILLTTTSEEKAAKIILNQIRRYIFYTQTSPAKSIPLVHADFLYLQDLLKMTLAGIRKIKNTNQPLANGLQLWKLMLRVLKKSPARQLPQRTLREQEENAVRRFLRYQIVNLLENFINENIPRTTPYLPHSFKNVFKQKQGVLRRCQMPVGLPRQVRKYKILKMRNNQNLQQSRGNEKLKSTAVILKELAKQTTRGTYREIMRPMETQSFNNKNKILYLPSLLNSNKTLIGNNYSRGFSKITTGYTSTLNKTYISRNFSTHSKKIILQRDRKLKQISNKEGVKLVSNQKNKKDNSSVVESSHVTTKKKSNTLARKVVEYWISKNKKIIFCVSPDFKGKKAQALRIKKNSSDWANRIEDWKNRGAQLRLVKKKRIILKKNKKNLYSTLRDQQHKRSWKTNLGACQNLLSISNYSNQYPRIPAHVRSNAKEKKLNLYRAFDSKISALPENGSFLPVILWERFFGLAGGRNVRLRLRMRALTQIPLANKKIPYWLFGAKFRLAHGKKRKTKKRRIPRYRRQLILKKIKKEPQRRATFRAIKQFIKRVLRSNKFKQVQRKYKQSARLAKKIAHFLIYLETRKAQATAQKFYNHPAGKVKWYIFEAKIKKGATELSKQLRRQRNSKRGFNFFTKTGQALARKLILHLRKRLQDGQYNSQQTLHTFTKHLVISQEENRRILFKKAHTMRRRALLEKLTKAASFTLNKQKSKIIQQDSLSMVSPEGRLLTNGQEKKIIIRLAGLPGYFSKKGFTESSRCTKTSSTTIKTKLLRSPLQLLRQSAETTDLKKNRNALNVFFDQSLSLLSEALKQRCASRQLQKLVRGVTQRKVYKVKSLKWWEQKSKDYIEHLANEFTPYELIEASGDTPTTRNHWVLGEDWEEINLLTPKFSEAENFQSNTIQGRLAVRSLPNNVTRSKHYWQFKQQHTLPKSVSTDFFEQKVKPSEADEIIEDSRRIPEDHRDWNATKVVVSKLQRQKTKNFGPLSTRRLNKFGVLRKTISNHTLINRRALRRSVLTAFKNETQTHALNENHHTTAAKYSVEAAIIPKALQFRKKDLGGRLTELEKRQWLAFQEQVRGQRYQRLVETADATTRLIPRLISLLTLSYFDNKKIHATVLKRAVRACYWGLRLQLGSDLDGWKTENLKDMEQKIRESRLLFKKNAKIESFSTKKFTFARYRFQPYAIIEAPDLADGAVLWLRQYAPLNYELYAEDSDRFNHLIVPPTRVKRGVMSNKNVVQWSTSKTITAPDSKVELLLAGRRSVASARYENILVQTRRLPSSSNFGAAATLHSTLVGSYKSATTSFFSRMYSTKASDLKSLTSRLSSGRRRVTAEEEGLTLSQSGSVHREIKARLAELTKTKIAVPEEQLMPGNLVPEYLRSKSARNGDYLTRLSNKITAPITKVTVSIATKKIELNTTEKQKIRKVRKNVFKSLAFNNSAAKLSRRSPNIKFYAPSILSNTVAQVPFIFPALLCNRIKRIKSTSYNLFNFKSNKRVKLLIGFYHKIKKESQKKLSRTKRSVSSRHSLLRRQPASYMDTNYRAALTASSNHIKLKRSVIRSVQWRKKHLRIRALIFSTEKQKRLSGSKLKFSKKQNLKTQAKTKVFGFPSNAMLIKKRKSFGWVIKKLKGNFTNREVGSYLLEKNYASQAANAAEQISWASGFRSLRPKVWDLLTLQKNKKHRVLKRWLKDLKIGFRERFWQSGIKQPTMTNEIFKTHRSRWRRLTWRDEDDSFDRDGLYKAFTFHPNERRNNAWLEALLIKRSLYSARRIAYRRLKFPHQYKNRRWIQRLRTQIYRNKLSHSYLKRRKWPTLRRYNRKIIQNAFKLRSKKSALKRTRNHTGRRPIGTGIEQKGLGFLDRLDVNLLLIKIAPTIFWAREIAHLGLLWVNGNKIVDPGFRFTPGDWIEWDFNTIRDFNTDFISQLKSRFIDNTFLETSLSYPRNYKYYPKIKLVRFIRLPQLEDFSEGLRINLLAFRWYLLDSGVGK